LEFRNKLYETAVGTLEVIFRSFIKELKTAANT